MCAKSHAGSPAGAAAAPVAPVAAGDVEGVAAAVSLLCAGRPAPEARGAAPPSRPPDRLRKPSTLLLKKSVQTSRREVAPPCEWPASQKACTFARPSCSMTAVTMFWRYTSSLADQLLV